MAAKKVSFNAKPKQEKPANIDEWVQSRDLETVNPKSSPSKEAPEKIKRLTLDIPESLHRAIKKKAVEDGETMADQLRSLLEAHYKDS